MEDLSEIFVFLAHQPLINTKNVVSGKDLDTSMNVVSGKGFDTSSTAKRAREDHDVLGQKLNIDADDIVISEDPNGSMMKLSPKLKEQLQKPWANALILKNMGRSHTLSFMLSKLSLKWSLIGHWQLTDLGDGYFVARFQMKEDLVYVLTNRPWVIANQYLAVQRWKPNFVPGEDFIQSMPIWVRLSDFIQTTNGMDGLRSTLEYRGYAGKNV
ncbi:hypothetical protein Ddye_023974 [Dipteronia dyeriana]|uniref:DUF4283 domain-containing protein n=1 Tax=Dipteronia dyeriana TaxID=168575 RepID=A0AAD9WT51_9ROSI|nr:hypothetical protein Ddye_023974 [Dipteronia dyeriana]